MPPITPTLNEPSGIELHDELAIVGVKTMEAGFIKVVLVVIEHPFASVTVAE